MNSTARAADGRREPRIVVVIDGYAAVRDLLDDVALIAAATRFDRVLRDGPALGIVAVITTDGSSLRGVTVPRSATWVFHVADDGIARTAGLRVAPVAPGRPGRMRVVESGLEGQVVFDPDATGHHVDHHVDHLVDDVADPDGRSPGPLPVTVLPDLVDPADLDVLAGCAGRRSGAGRPVELIVGIGADDLEPARLRVPVGDHVFIGGSARTGRSTALRQVEAAWCGTHPGGRVIRVDRRHPIDAAHTTAAVGDGTPVLIVADDAERVDDADGTIARLVTQPGVMFAVAARLEAVRVAYGHWTREVARSRCGLIMTAMGDLDGELLGVTLPRCPPIPPRPGLAWIVDQVGPRLAQVAARMAP